ncbi:hypothetical protein AB205_0120370 [Aquarana catesbeiana]|uniref:Uncharacterized protein n=1 Tax=Aquarana catesbeiana TaxID=8400 RepID=A0A2G9S6L9_AQUCT|nr:hypothetical protein AB205_0120370 [Aquarana catesbeiana]
MELEKVRHHCDLSYPITAQVMAIHGALPTQVGFLKCLYKLHSRITHQSPPPTIFFTT